MTSGPGYPSAVISVTGGLLATIPAPVIPAGPVPPSLRYVTVTNSSPFTLLVSHGAVLGELAAFTADLFVLQSYQDAANLTVLAQQGSGTLQPGFDHEVFAVWYEDDPGGNYPAAIGAGAIAIETVSTLFEQQAFGNPPSLVQNLTVDPFNGISLSVIDQGPFTTVINVQLLWTDANFFLVAEQTFNVGPNMTLGVRLPAFSPRVTISVSATTTGPSTVFVEVVGIPGTCVPGFGSDIGLHNVGVILDGTVSVGAGATTLLDATSWVYAGPCHIFLTPGALATYAFFLDVMNDAGVYVNKLQWSQADVTASPHMFFPWIAPATPFQIRGRNNTGAPGNMSAYVVADVFR